PVAVPGAALPADDRELIARLARDTWRGLEALVDREHQLPVDHVHLGATPDDSRVGDYTNVTTVGLRLIAIVAARELGLLADADAVQRVAALLDTLDRLETHGGFFFNYYDTTSLERTSNLISFVDSSWLTAGLMVVRTTFPALAARATAVIARQDYRFFWDEKLQQMSHGYWVHLGARSRFHYGVLYAESRLGSLIAIGKGDAPPAHWFRMTRTFSPTCTWQTQRPKGRHAKTVDGHRFLGGWYEWGGTRYVPSWGGSMFEALMPTLVIDERRLAPASLGANDAAHVAVQRRFATEALGYPVWGISPSTIPGTIGYGEYGVRVLGALGYAAGGVTPHATALALAVDPAAAIANLRALATRYALYGDFGFYDAVEPRTGTVARTYLTLDQAMVFIAAANWLTEGRIQARFAADPIAMRALPVVAGERFFD
ncbi:MAG TPA: glucoamylase family protein, partial [Candidatus Binatia bacterium]|nr:glucoamylase family protein [Candidatus Binatia bacterium]